MEAWRSVGFVPVSHLVFVKDYASKTGFTRSCHECAYVLAGIRLRRDIWVSVRYAEELNSDKSSVTPQRTDRHGILGEKHTDLQVSL
jgi:hypothetical protein